MHCVIFKRETSFSLREVDWKLNKQRVKERSLSVYCGSKAVGGRSLRSWESDTALGRTLSFL